MLPRALRAYRAIAVQYASVHGIPESMSEAVRMIDGLAASREHGLSSTLVPLNTLEFIHALTAQQLAKDAIHAA